MYPEEMVNPMRAELTDAGFKNLYTADDVKNAIKAEGTTLVVINSVCGCAARNARPGAKMSLEGGKKPANLITVFAGVDREAVDAARAEMFPFPPSSPSMASRSSCRWQRCQQTRPWTHTAPAACRPSRTSVATC